MLLSVVLICAANFVVSVPLRPLPSESAVIRARRMSIEEIAVLRRIRDGVGYAITDGTNLVVQVDGPVGDSDLRAMVSRLGYGMSTGDGVTFYDRAIMHKEAERVNEPGGAGAVMPVSPGVQVAAEVIERRGWLECWLVDRSELNGVRYTVDVAARGAARREPVSLLGALQEALRSATPAGLVVSSLRDFPVHVILDRLSSSGSSSVSQRWKGGITRKGRVSLRRGRETRFFNGTQSTVVAGSVIQNTTAAELKTGVQMDVDVTGGVGRSWDVSFKVTVSSVDGIVEGLPQTRSVDAMAKVNMIEGATFLVTEFTSEEMNASRARHFFVLPSVSRSQTKSDFSLVCRIVAEPVDRE